MLASRLAFLWRSFCNLNLLGIGIDLVSSTSDLVLVSDVVDIAVAVGLGGSAAN